MMATRASSKECYRRALKAIDSGELERAFKLLTLANLKAPENNEIRAALHQVSQSLQMHRKHMAAADLLLEARTRIDEGDLNTAQTLLQITHAQPPHPSNVHAVERQHPDHSAPSPKRNSTQALQDLTREMANTLPKTRPVPFPLPVGKPFLVLLVIFALICVTWAARSWMFRHPAVDIAPYAEHLPVQHGYLTGDSLQEVILVIDQDRWVSLTEDRRPMLEDSLTVAREQGYSAIYLYDDAGQFLGSINHQAIYLP